jgi:hypothetical protein
MKKISLLKKLAISFLLFGLTSIATAFAQTAPEAEITDEELQKYAIAMDSIDQMKAAILVEMNTMVKSNENIKGARYNDLHGAINDEAKLAELKATEEEIAFVKSVIAKKEEMTANVQTTFQSLAKDYIGAKSYNKVKAALAKDAEVKSRYEKILAEVSKKEEKAESTGN